MNLSKAYGHNDDAHFMQKAINLDKNLGKKGIKSSRQEVEILTKSLVFV